jgi:hypothetical protein
MSWHIPDNERSYLRDLANKQAGYAALPVMEERKKIWYDLNDGHSGYIPPVVVETWTFDRDFLPERVFRCKSETGKSIEYQLLRNIRNYEFINDDKVMPDFFEINWFLDIDEFGVKVGREIRKDAEGYELGYRYLHPIKDLEADFQLFKPAVCKVDREKTMSWKSFLEGIFGDVLPVTIRTNNLECTSLTNRAIELMGMEAFYSAMLLNPGGVHLLMAYLRDNALSIMRWVEAEGLIIVNNGNQDSFGTSFNFTSRLPSPEYNGGPARLCDFWGNSNSEETVGISPEMYQEFCLPYYIDVCEPMGLLYYGCCEPAHPVWDSVRQLPHLQKVSISPWCDQEFMGDVLRGTEIVFSRKPDPKYLGVDVTLNEEKWRAHIRETLDATQGVFTEFIIRDVYTVHGKLDKARRCVELARQEIEKHKR